MWPFVATLLEWTTIVYMGGIWKGLSLESCILMRHVKMRLDYISNYRHYSKIGSQHNQEGERKHSL